MLRIKHKQNECIGCAQCVELAPDYWELDQDGMAQLLYKSSQWGGHTLGEGFDSDKETLDLAAESCPVNIIKVQ
jgi:ferredoxin